MENPKEILKRITSEFDIIWHNTNRNLSFCLVFYSRSNNTPVSYKASQRFENGFIRNINLAIIMLETCYRKDVEWDTMALKFTQSAVTKYLCTAEPYALPVVLTSLLMVCSPRWSIDVRTKWEFWAFTLIPFPSSNGFIPWYSVFRWCNC